MDDVGPLERLHNEHAGAVRAFVRRRIGDADADPGHGTEGGVVLRALASLSVRDREVLLLVTWDGLTLAEAAEVLGIASSGVSMRVHRARRRLARALEHDGHRPLPPRGRSATDPATAREALQTGEHR